MTEKSCGSCTMCCKLLGIKELQKPVMQWCGYCNKGKGCGIYADRPPSCAEYECAYLMAFDQGVTPPLAMRPDKSKVVISPGMGTHNDGHEMVAVHVDPGYPNAWRDEPVIGLLQSMALSGARVIIASAPGNRKTMLVPMGPNTVGARPITMSDPDADGVQWLTEG